MSYKDLADFFDPDLYLPIRGKTYQIASPNADDGLRLRNIFSDPTAEFTDGDEIKEMQNLLGPVWDEMKADGVDWASLCHAGRTALFHYGLGKTLAEIQWTTGLGESGNPLPAEPAPMNRASKRAATKKKPASKARTARSTPDPARTRTTTQAADHTTPQQDSATGTGKISPKPSAQAPS